MPIDEARSERPREAAAEVDDGLARRWLRLRREVVAVAGVLGLAYATLVPPLQVADEVAHLDRAWGISRGWCIAKRKTAIPRSFLSLEAAFPAVVERHRPIAVADVTSWVEVPLASQDRARVLVPAANAHRCVAYLPAALGIRLASAFELSPLLVLLAGRLASLLAYLAVVAAALRIAPDLHAALVAVALMPIALHQAASVSADAMTNALALAATAAALRMATAPSRAGPQAPAVLGFAAILGLAALCKGNLALVPLAAMPHRSRFASRGRHLAAIAFVAACALGAVGAWSLVDAASVRRFAEWQDRTLGIDVAGNAAHAAAHPIAFAVGAARRVVGDLGGLVEHLIGVLGWGTVVRPRWSTWLYGMLLIAAPFAGTRRLRLGGVQRLALASAVAIGLAAAAVAMWLFLGRVDAAHPARIVVPPIAGRYLVPFALAGLAAISWPVGGKRAPAAARLALAVAAVVNAAALAAVVRHYYSSDRYEVDTAIVDFAAPHAVPIANGTRVEQDVTARLDGASRIDLAVATYGKRIPAGTLTVVVTDADGRELGAQRTPLVEIDDNSFLTVALPPHVARAGRRLTLRLAVDGMPPGHLLAAYATARDAYPLGSLRVDGREEGRDLQLRVLRRADR